MSLSPAAEARYHARCAEQTCSSWTRDRGQNITIDISPTSQNVILLFRHLAGPHLINDVASSSKHKLKPFESAPTLKRKRKPASNEDVFWHPGRSEPPPQSFTPGVHPSPSPIP